MRGNTCQLIDVTVVRPTTLTLLQRGSATNGAHLRPLVAARHAERRKHQTYDAECARHQWRLVPFALESLGAKGTEATQLLQRMAAHSLDLSPQAFLLHATRRLSITLQSGNAGIAVQGTTDLLLQQFGGGAGHHEVDLPLTSSTLSPGRGPGRNHRRRAAVAEAAAAAVTRTAPAEQFSSVVHADYHSARTGAVPRRVTVGSGAAA